MKDYKGFTYNVEPQSATMNITTFSSINAQTLVCGRQTLRRNKLFAFRSDGALR
jgi:hypothetical protein